MKRLLSVLLTVLLVVSMACTAAVAEKVKEPPVYTDLEQGAKGKAVTNMQKRLKELGFFPGKADGQFGKSTTGSIKAFQKYNDMEETGEATAAFQEFLYSDSVIAAPTPDAEITSVRLTTDEFGYHAIQVTVRNNLEEGTIDGLTLHFLTYDVAGRIYYDNSRSLGYVSSMTRDCTKTIKPGKTTTYTIKSLFGSFNTMPAKVAVGIYKYHVDSGKTFGIAPHHMILMATDGTKHYPDKSDYKPVEIGDTDLEKAGTILFGYSSYDITEYVASYLYRHPGCLIDYVTYDTMADRAGLRAGDVITTIDGVDVLEPFAEDRAREKIADGETVSVNYIRNMKEYTTEFSLSLYDDVPADSEEEAPGAAN